MASHGRARAFFWTVLFAATGVSIAANAAHANLVVTDVPGMLAAAVATVPPVVLLVATEGLSILVRTHQRSSLIYAVAVVMTVFLALAAFALSFFSLRDLAIRCGIHPWLAWLWPLVVDVCIAQCTVVLQALNHRGNTGAGSEGPAGTQSTGSYVAPHPELEDTDAAIEFDAASDDDGSADLLPVAQEIVEGSKTKQSPEVVAEVLRRHRSGELPGTIASAMRLHHTTVTKLLNEGHRRTLAGHR